jgi:FkbM family methyltransferase
MIDVTEAYGFTFAFPASDSAVGRCLRDYGEFARIGSTLAAQLSAGGTFIDVGANIGAYTLPVSRSANRVIAIEAQPAIVELLRRNISDNDVGNVQVIAAAAGYEVGEVEFPHVDLAASINFGAVGIGRTPGPTVRVPVIRLDDVAPPDTKCVKVDVEGYEPEVLTGALRVVTQVRPHWLVEVAIDTHRTRGVIGGLQQAGYRTYWLYDPFVTPRAPKAEWKGNEPGDVNVFAVPRETQQPVGMVEIGSEYHWPTSTVGFTYLHAFGIASDLET